MNEQLALNTIKQHWNFSQKKIQEAKIYIEEHNLLTEEEVTNFLNTKKPPITEEQEQKWKKARKNKTLKMLGTGIVIVIIWFLRIWLRSR